MARLWTGAVAVMAVLVVVVLRSDGGLARMNPLRREETSACAPIKSVSVVVQERQQYIAGKGCVCTVYSVIQADFCV